MAIRIQLRRDTAANWVSSNPVLRQGEIGIETDTLQMKLGNGTSTWTQITGYMNLVPDGNLTIGDYVMVNDIGASNGVVGLDNSKNALIPGASIILEGATDNSYETTLTVTDPTADRTITFKNADGTVAFVTDIPSTTDALTEGSTNKYFSDERAQDAVANSLAAGTHTNITVTYNDAANSLSLAAAPGYVDEQAVDAVAAALAAGTHTNISVSYNDAGNAISLTGAQTYNDENAQDAIGNNLGTGLSYNDTTGAISVDTSIIQARVTNVTDTEIGYLDGVTSAIQTQIDTKLASSTASSTYAPIASPTFTGTVAGITKSMVGLGNVDNTTDALKPISTATQTALDLKAPIASPTFTGTVTIPSGANISGFAPLASPDLTGIPTAPTAISSTNTTQVATTAYVKSVVSDLTNGAGAAYDTLKELQDLIVADEGAVSSLTTLVGTKAPIASPTFTGTVSGITKSMVGLGNVDNTSDASKPISTATQTALDLKLASATAATTYAPLASPTFTGTVTGTFSGNLTGDVTGNVSGNAGTATNGVVTTGTYSNPSWITGLGWSKISSTPTTLSGYGITDALASSTAASTYLTQSNAASTYAPIASPTFTGTVSGITKTMVGLGSVENTALSTWAGSSNITTLGTIATGTWSGTTIATTKGGTGLTSYTTGDILYSSATDTLAKLAAGSNGQILTLAAGVPTWAAAPITLPTQTGNSGKYLTTDGSSATWGTLVVPITTGTATVNQNTAQDVDTIALSAFTSAEYMVSIKQGSKIRTSKVIIQTDGTSVDMTEFAITETGGTLSGVVVSATTASSNAKLQVTVTDALSTNATVKFSKIAL